MNSQNNIAMKKLFLMFAVAGFVLSTASATLAGDDKDKKDAAKKECSKDAKSCCKKDASKACAKADTKSCHSDKKAEKKPAENSTVKK
jgi:hypothetical protein